MRFGQTKPISSKAIRINCLVAVFAAKKGWIRRGGVGCDRRDPRHRGGRVSMAVTRSSRAFSRSLRSLSEPPGGACARNCRVRTAPGRPGSRFACRAWFPTSALPCPAWSRAIYRNAAAVLRLSCLLSFFARPPFSRQRLSPHLQGLARALQRDTGIAQVPQLFPEFHPFIVAHGFPPLQCISPTAVLPKEAISPSNVDR